MKRLFLMMLLCVCTFALWAVPAKRITLTVKQPDGTMLVLTQRGDEHFHYLMTEDGIMVKSNGEAYYYADIVDGNIVASKHLAHISALRSSMPALGIKLNILILLYKVINNLNRPPTKAIIIKPYVKSLIIGKSHIRPI